jgi:predicted porin
MQKTLLAAALVAGFAGVAHAESSVTLYGLADVGYGFKHQSVKIDGVKTTHRYVGAYNGVKNGNRWGLKGSEDLGNGTSAIFQLESGFTIGDGRSAQEGRLFGRQAYVGLSGESWGTFTVGRQYNAADAFVSGIDPFATGFSQAASVSTFGNSLSTQYDAAIKYVSPNFAGFQFGVGLVHQDSKTEVADEESSRDKLTGVTLGLGYNNAGLEFGASFDLLRVKKSAVAGSATTYAGTFTPADGSAPVVGTFVVPGVTTPAVDHTQRAWNLGVAYDLDVVKLHAMYGQQRDGSWGGELYRDLLGAVATPAEDAAFHGDGYKSQAWLAGITAPVGEAGKVMFSYQGSKAKNTDVADNLRYNTHLFSLGYAHNLSKRTAVYAVASYGKVKAKYDGGRDTLKSTQVIGGLQHRF